MSNNFHTDRPAFRDYKSVSKYHEAVLDYYRSYYEIKSRGCILIDDEWENDGCVFVETEKSTFRDKVTMMFMRYRNWRQRGC